MHITNPKAYVVGWGLGLLVFVGFAAYVKLGTWLRARTERKLGMPRIRKAGGVTHYRVSGGPLDATIFDALSTLRRHTGTKTRTGYDYGVYACSRLSTKEWAAFLNTDVEGFLKTLVVMAEAGYVSNNGPQEPKRFDELRWRLTWNGRATLWLAEFLLQKD